MLIRAGQHDIWQDFALDIPHDLEFLPGSIYHLQGANGSGKSSFLTQILLPILRGDKSCYKIYLEQQMHIQLYTVKAYAAIMKPHQIIAGEQDVALYLLGRLKDCVDREPRPCYILLDESHQESLIRDFLKEHIPSYCLVYSSHSKASDADQRIVFDSAKPGLSRVYASAD